MNYAIWDNYFQQSTTIKTSAKNVTLVPTNRGTKTVLNVNYLKYSADFFKPRFHSTLKHDRNYPNSIPSNIPLCGQTLEKHYMHGSQKQQSLNALRTAQIEKYCVATYEECVNQPIAR